jgi:hypothetical protein
LTRTRTLIPILLLVSPPVLAGGPPPDDQAPKQLIELRSELFEAGEAKALEQMPRFRALCDDQGYPLVGNAVRKNEVFQPSQFCAAVRSASNKA